MTDVPAIVSLDLFKLVVCGVGHIQMHNTDTPPSSLALSADDTADRALPLEETSKMRGTYTLVSGCHRIYPCREPLEFPGIYLDTTSKEVSVEQERPIRLG